MSLIKAMKSVQNKCVTTENGAISNESTLSSLVDLFAKISAMRQQDEDSVYSLFSKAYGEDPLLAMKILFNSRDIRGSGQGERKTFRIILKRLAQVQPEIIEKNLENVPFFGRWDDLWELEGTAVWESVLKMIRRQINKDIKTLRSEEDTSISLLSKWMPSINTSSKESVRLAKVFAKFLKWDYKKYRKTLSKLREKIDIVERKMTSGEWKDINYEAIPSRASMIYRKAFGKHDGTRYVGYLDKVKKGEAKINTGTLYPYDIVRNILHSNDEDITLELQWKNLPNYAGDKPVRALVVCDVSGSMTSGGTGNVKPIEVSLSLALYCAERMEGIFKNHFITFSNTPKLQTVCGASLREKIQNLCKAQWDMTTDLQKAFNLILDSAVKNKISEDEMPETLMVISDMQMNDCGCNTNYETIKRKYEQSGYKFPNLVWWNVNARGNEYPMTVDDRGCMVSGCSPSVLKAVLNKETITPVGIMMDVIGKERYNCVKV